MVGWRSLDRDGLAEDGDLGGSPVRRFEMAVKPTSSSAGKSGGSLDLIFFDLGVALSRALQGRDPRDGR
jgi:hypothetical protein